MSALRGILIAFAVLLLVGIYWWGRRENRRRSQPAASAPSPQPPTLVDATDPSHDVVLAEPLGEVSTLQLEPIHAVPEDVEAPHPAEETPEESPQKIVVLRLVAAVPRFSGAHLRAALEGESLQFGKYRIFHRTTAAGAIVFSVASMTEPGSFDPEHMFHEQYTGIALFAQLPGPVDGVSMLNDLISCARKLQQTLGGVLQDEQGAALQASRIEQLRREVRELSTTRPK